MEEKQNWGDSVGVVEGWDMIRLGGGELELPPKTSVAGAALIQSDLASVKTEIVCCRKRVNAIRKEDVAGVVRLCSS